MRYLAIVALLVILFLVPPIFAETYRGIVADRGGNPIGGVNILTDLSSLTAVTADDGRFSIETGLLQPSYLTFSHVSYQPTMISVKPEMPREIRVILDLAIYPGQKIRVTAERAVAGLSPIAYSDFTDKDIERDYMISEFPLLLESTPNFYAYADAGGGLGYSYMKIRGFGDKHISVYINGIPLNDPEDHATYFVDIPDFAAEVSDIQVQRGVGNSLYGDASFGGSVNIASPGLEKQRRISVTSGYGQYFADGDFVSEMRKQSVDFSSGLIDGRWFLAGRYSKQFSGGYRENSWYDGWAYYFSLSRLDPNMTTTINLYGGPMKMRLAYYGVDRATLAQNRRSNSAYGLDYGNATDNFSQPHYEIHNTLRLNDDLSFYNTLYYIRGKGYYEQFKDDRDIDEYNISPSALADPAITEIDLVRQKWVTKNQYGWNPRLDLEHKNGSAALGGSLYYFDSKHWGQVVWAENLIGDVNPQNRYYEYFGKKYHASLYAMEYYYLSEKIRLMGNIQLKYLKYNFEQSAIGAFSGENFDLDWLFLSPRLGLTYLLDDRTDLYFGFAVSSHEPTDETIYEADDPGSVPAIENGELIVDAERVYDFEVGGNWRSDRLRLGLSLFWMEFRNEFIPEGGLDDDGRPVLGNADRSVHSGIELTGAFSALQFLTVTGNAAFNRNRLKEYFVYKDSDWNGIVDDTLDYSDNPTAGFPEYLANLIFDYNRQPYRLTYRLRAIGKQYVENSGNEDLSIEAYLVSSLSGSFSLGSLGDFGRLTIFGRVDNLFNEKYELAGYAYEWGGQWYGEYFPAAERNFFVQLRWEFE